MGELGLGFHQLNAAEKKAYNIILKALKNYRSSCDISSVSAKTDMSKIIGTVLGDNPDIIYFNKCMFLTQPGVFSKQIKFVGCLSKSQIQKKEAALKMALENAVWEIDKNARNDREILQGITEYLQRNVKYDYAEAAAGKFRAGRPFDSHNAYGALVNYLAVCDGISSAYSLIAQYFGFRCMLAEGSSTSDRLGTMNHAWNIVEYNGKFYHIDATWDVNAYEVGEHYSYGYFGLDDDEIAFDHQWDFHSTPICNGKQLSYFSAYGLIAQSESEIESILIREVKKGNQNIQMRIFAGIPLPQDTDAYWRKCIETTIGRFGKFSGYSFIWNDKTRCVSVFLE